MKTLSWNGWQYSINKKGYWKTRHNPSFENFIEKELISREEFDEVFKKNEKIFG